MSFFWVFFLFASCATSPKTGPVLAEGVPDFSVFPAGAGAYLWVDVDRSRPLLEAFSFDGLSGKDASQILDRTGTALLAVYSGDASRRFFLAGQGTYPSLRAGVSMSFSRDWKRVKSDTGNRYWYSSGFKLGVALGPSVAFVSDGDPFSPGAGVDPSPPGFEDFRRASSLSGWLVNPNEAINGFISALGLPIEIPAEEFFFGASRLPAENARPDSAAADNNSQGELISSGAGNAAGEGPWELVLRIKTPSPGHARSFLSLFSMARLFLRSGLSNTGPVPGAEPEEEGSFSFGPAGIAALLFANVPVQDGEYLTLRTSPLREERMALLFKMFQLYSNQ